MMQTLDEINNKFTFFEDHCLQHSKQYRYIFGNWGMVKRLYQIIDEKTIKKICKQFNGKMSSDGKMPHGYIFFKTEEDAQKCCDYLNEVYLPMIKLMEFK